MTLDTPVYQQTRQAWRDIWIGTEFDRELRSLDYPRSREVLDTYMPYLPRDKPILEAGCGPGHVVYYLREHGYPAIGLDYAPEALHFTHERLPDLPLHLGDVHALPYPSDTFGGYLSFGVVEHFEHGPGAALAEAYRILAPGGVLVITVPHPQWVENLYALRQRIAPTSTPRAGYYERTYTHSELADHSVRAGFAIALVKPIGHSYTFYGLSPLFRRASSYYESSPLGEQMGAIGRRWLPWQTAFHTLIIAHKPPYKPKS